MRSSMEVRGLEPYSDDAVAAADQLGLRAQAALQAGRAQSFGRTANDEKQRRWRMSTSLPVRG